MLKLISKLAPLLTGITQNEDGTDKAVSGEFQWLVRLPLLVGAILVLAGLFAPVTEAQRDEVYQAGMVLLVGGPFTYVSRRALTKGDAMKAPAPVAAPPSPPAEIPVAEAPKDDAEAAKSIENL